MRADRLVSLVLLLRRRGRLSAAEIARELEVSTRTVLRDIEALSIAGVPVYAERGRHGGYGLLPGFQTQLTGLTHDESLALLVVGSRRGVQAFGLGSALASAILKVMDALPEGPADTASAASERILIDPEIDLLSREQQADDVPDHIIAEVRAAVITGHKLNIQYAAINQDVRWRTLDPLGLVSVHGQVYLLATRDGNQRTYRLSRIRAAECLKESAQRSPDIDLEQMWQERSTQFRAGGEQVVVELRVSPTHLSTLHKTALLVAETDGTENRDDSWPMLRATFQDSRHAIWALWELAGQAETLDPEWLRDALRDRAAEVSALYAGM